MRWQRLSVVMLLVVTGCSAVSGHAESALLRPPDVRLKAAVTPADEWLRLYYPNTRWMLQVDLGSAGPPLLPTPERYSYMVYAFNGQSCILPSDWGEAPGGSKRDAAATDPYLIASDGLSWEAAVQATQSTGGLSSTASELPQGYGFRYLGTHSTAKVRYALSGDQPPTQRVVVVFVLSGAPPERKVLWTTTALATLFR